MVYSPDDQGAAISSGSFPTDGMVIVPCSGSEVTRLGGGDSLEEISIADQRDHLSAQGDRLAWLASEVLDQARTSSRRRSSAGSAANQCSSAPGWGPNRPYSVKFSRGTSLM